jgi:hypothetical protein
MFVPMDYEQAHGFVEQNHSKRSVHWEGWDMIFFTPSDSAQKDPKGVYYRGRWGFETRVSVLDDGTWEVPGQYVSNTTGRTRARR